MILPFPSENPVFTKHWRSRLRPQHWLPLMIIVAVICVCIIWAVTASEDVADSGKLGLRALVFIQGLILFLAGTYMVHSSVATARSSGMLDFHRISPQRPDVLVLGFLLGGAVREWLLFAVTIPFSGALALIAGVDPSAWVLMLVQIISTALLYHAIGLVAGLVSEGRGGTALLIMLLVFLYAVGRFTPIAYLTAGPAINQAIPEELYRWRPETSYSFYGVLLSPVLISLLHQVPLLLFLLIAAERKMRHDLAPPYSKPVAVVFYAALAAIALGDVIHASGSLGGRYPTENLLAEPGLAGPALCYALFIAGLLLALAVTPGAGGFLSGIRHARKLGMPHVALWSDASANWAPLLSFAAVFMLAALGRVGLVSESGTGVSQLLIAAGIGACSVVFFGAARQSFELVFKKRSGSYFLLLLFFLWGVPLLLGIVTGAAMGFSSESKAAAQTFLALSPVTGIGMVFADYGAGHELRSQISLGVSMALAVCFMALSLSAARQARERAETPA